MSTLHQAMREWEAAALDADRRASELDQHTSPDAAVASEIARLNATLCGIAALMVEGVALLKTVEVAISQTGAHINQR